MKQCIAATRLRIASIKMAIESSKNILNDISNRKELDMKK